MNDISKIIKSLEDPGLYSDGVTETVKHERNKKNKKADFLELFLEPLATSLVQSRISLVVKGKSGRGVTRWIKTFSSTPSFKKGRDYSLFQI